MTVLEQAVEESREAGEPSTTAGYLLNMYEHGQVAGLRGPFQALLKRPETLGKHLPAVHKALQNPLVR